MPTPSVKDKLKLLNINLPRPTIPKPLWQGPNGVGINGGVTQGLISKWLACRSRAQIQLMQGLRPPERFNARIEYGNLWHTCEEALAKGADWKAPLRSYCKELSGKYRFQQEEVQHWYDLCLVQFPLYVAYWAKHPDVKDRTPLFQEQEFDIPYTLPSGRIVRLRGKWDSVDLQGKGKQVGLVLQENKSKSSIDQDKILRQLNFDLQTMFYLVTLEKYDWGHGSSPPIRGVRYNVIRRSAHKTKESMLKKMTEDADNNRSGEWFARWNVEVNKADIDKFKVTCLHPILENLYDDWEWWDYNRTHNETISLFDYKARKDCCPNHINRQYILPYGGHSPVSEGGEGDVDTYLLTGNPVGLERRDVLFPELKY